jgi:hypothetical protein
MRNFLLAGFSILCFSSLSSAATFNCEWQNRSDYPKNFYRPASVHFEVKEKTVKILSSNYFSRLYQPCWTGEFTSCYFNFDIDLTQDLEITAQTDKTISVEQQYYFVASFDMTFAKKYSAIAVGEKVNMKISGDDGDGTYIENDTFTCLKEN